MWNNSMHTIYFREKDNLSEYYERRFNSENSYHFSFNIAGNEAFFFYHKDIMKTLSDISFLDKEVESLMKKLPAVALQAYVKKSLTDEIFYTNEIEGVISTRKEITEIIDNFKKRITPKPNKINSLANKYLMLMDKEHEMIKEVTDIRKIYDDLVLDEVLENDIDDKPDGVIFRAKAVEVRNETSGRVIHEGMMPESSIIECLSNAVNFLNDESIVPLIRIAAFHYIFSFVHPFYDGNGRINRFISSMYLKKYYSAIIPYRLSLTIKENKKQYYDAFDITNSARNKGDISTFIYEFVDIVKKSYQTTIEYLTIKQHELDEKRECIKLLELDDNGKNILWYLTQRLIFKDEFAYINDICEFTNLSSTTVRKVLGKLLDKDLITQKSESKFKTYMAK